MVFQDLLLLLFPWLSNISVCLLSDNRVVKNWPCRFSSVSRQNPYPFLLQSALTTWNTCPPCHSAVCFAMCFCLFCSVYLFFMPFPTLFSAWIVSTHSLEYYSFQHPRPITAECMCFVPRDSGFNSS